MLELYRKLVEKGLRTLESVPEKYRKMLEGNS